MQLNSTKPIAGFLAMAFFAYAGYCVLTSDPLERMDRMCTPATLWPGRVIVSGARVFHVGQPDWLQQKFDNGFYTCRRWVWGALYKDEYEAQQAKEAERNRADAQPSAGAADAVSAPKASQ